MRKEYDFSKAKLVVPPQDPRKTRITIRIDTKILDWFRQTVDDAGGGNYQTMINAALKHHIESEDAKTRRCQGSPGAAGDVIYPREGEGEGAELKGGGYNLKENIRDWDSAGKKGAERSTGRQQSLATKTVKYNQQGIDQLPEDQPVLYRIMTESGRLNYVGVAQKGYVRKRISGHLDKVPGVKVHIEQFENLQDAMKKEIKVIRRAQAKYDKEGK